MKRSFAQFPDVTSGSDQAQHGGPFAPPREDPRMVHAPLATDHGTFRSDEPPQGAAAVSTSAISASPAATTPTASGLVPVLAFSGIVVAVMQTLLVPVIADLPRLLDTTTSNAAWVITATLLSSAVATPVMGRLGDLYGKRRFVLFSLALMVLGLAVLRIHLRARADGPGPRHTGLRIGRHPARHRHHPGRITARTARIGNGA